jgi:hypothetical protein
MRNQVRHFSIAVVAALTALVVWANVDPANVAAASTIDTGLLVTSGDAICFGAGNSDGSHLIEVWPAQVYAYDQHRGVKDWQDVTQRAWLAWSTDGGTTFSWARDAQGNYISTKPQRLPTTDRDGGALTGLAWTTPMFPETLSIPRLDRIYRVYTWIEWAVSGTVTVGGSGWVVPAHYELSADLPMLLSTGSGSCDYRPREITITYPATH